MKRRAKNPTIDHLRRMELFSTASDKQLARVAGVLTETSVPAGAVLTRQDRREREQCFLVIDGEAVVSRDGVALAELGPGALIGEAATLTGGRRSATVIASTPLRVLIFDQQTFQPVLDTMPSVRRSVMRCLAGRLRSADAALVAAR